MSDWRTRLSRASLAARLLAASLVVIAILLPLAGLVLAQQFRAAVTSSHDAQLQTLLNHVIAGIRLPPGSEVPVHDRSTGEPHFQRILSGWYWQISANDAPLLASRSLWDQRLPLSGALATQPKNIDGPRGQPLRLIERQVQLASLGMPLRVSVAVSRQGIALETARFNRLLSLSLIGLGMVLLGALAAQVRWGLAPLRRLRQDLASVERGETRQLGEQLPGELARLAGAINAVLSRDQQRLQRARHAADNLAHALKTPVSVLTTLAEGFPEPSRQRVQGELKRIDEAVRHHLARASAAGTAVLHPPVLVKPTLAPLIEGLGRLAERRGLVLHTTIDSELALRIDPQDLQEMIGNLLDNALRWARQDVQLEAGRNQRHGWLRIRDDGPGMTPHQCQTALARGSRLDEQRSGTGLGLAIVNDLVRLYDGQLTLTSAAQGGLVVEILLPLDPWHRLTLTPETESAQPEEPAP